jgi:dihydroorotase
VAEQRRGFELVVRGGRVIDAAQGVDAALDVGISGGKVVALEPGLAAGGHEVDARGCVVLPGLVDLHTHVFWGYGHHADADAHALPNGTTTVVDAGTAGCQAMDAFRRYVAERSTARVLAFVNVSSIGQLDIRIGELHNRSYLDEAGAADVVRAHPELVRGVKVRLSDYVCGGFSRLVLEATLRVAEAAGVPLMAHIGDTSEPLEALLPLFRAGDIVTHSFSGRRRTLLDRNGRVLPQVREARARGVLFDGASGRSHFSSRTAERLLEHDFLPDTLSTDMSGATAGWLSMPYVMSRLLSLGMDLPMVARMATTAPARALGEPSLGTLAVGAEADVAVLELADEAWTFTDSDGEERRGERLARPRATICKGRLVGA